MLHEVATILSLKIKLNVYNLVITNSVSWFWK